MTSFLKDKPFVPDTDCCDDGARMIYWHYHSSETGLKIEMIVGDGRADWVYINYCPFCGKRLNE